MRSPFVLCPDLINADLLMLPGLVYPEPRTPIPIPLNTPGFLYKPLAGIVAVFC